MRELCKTDKEEDVLELKNNFKNTETIIYI